MAAGTLPSPQSVASARRELGSRLVAFAERWFDIPEGSITNPKRRNGNITKARWAIACALTDIAGWSQPAIAKLFGQADHTSINNGLKRSQELLRTDEVFFEGVKLLKLEISPE